MRSPFAKHLGAMLLFFAQVSGAIAAPSAASPMDVGNVPPATEGAAVDPVILADRALQGRRIFEAEAYRALLAADSRPEARLLRAELALMSGDPTEAMALLGLVDADPMLRCRAGGVAAAALLQLEQLDRAQTQSDALKNSCWNDPFYWRAKGRIAYARSAFDAAVAAFREALVLDPSDQGTKSDLAVSLISVGNASEAAQLLAELLRQSPEAKDILLNLDYANAMRGIEPVRGPQEDDNMWSIRLQFAGQGAQQGGRKTLAASLLARALLNRPRYDQGLWQQYSEAGANND